MGQDDFDELEGGKNGLEGSAAVARDEATEEPLSFSQVDLSKDDATIAEDFPRFPGMAAGLACTLEAGKIYSTCCLLHPQATQSQVCLCIPTRKPPSSHPLLCFKMQMARKVCENLAMHRYCPFSIAALALRRAKRCFAGNAALLHYADLHA